MAHIEEKGNQVHEGTAEHTSDNFVRTVLHTGGVHLASEKAVVERALSKKPGVASVECNPVSQTTTVRYDPHQTSVAELQACIQGCGYDCAGESLPSYIGKAGEASSLTDLHTAHVAAVRAGPADHGAMVMAPEELAKMLTGIVQA